MKPLGEKRQEFIAKFLADLAKAIFAVGLASYFFKDFPTWLKIVLGGLFFGLAILSTALYPENGGD